MSTPAWSLGVGRPQAASALGQPLNLLFPIQLGPGETLTADCIRAEVLAGDNLVLPSALQWQLEGDGAAPRGVRLRSTQAIDEPLVSVQLSVGCPARLTRQFTAFIDPPGHSQDAAAAEPGAVVTTLTAPAATPTAGQTSREARGREEGANSTGRVNPSRLAEVTATVAASAPTAAGSAPQRARRAAARRAPDHAMVASPPSAQRATAAPRLSLEPAEALTLPSPAQLAAEAAASAASAAELAQRQLQSMEKRVADLQTEQQRTQAALQALRQELVMAREAASGDSGRMTSVWLLGLTLLSLGLAASTVLLWRGRRSPRDAEQSWWSESRQDASALADPTASATGADGAVSRPGGLSPLPASAPAVASAFSSSAASGSPSAASGSSFYAPMPNTVPAPLHGHEHEGDRPGSRYERHDDEADDEPLIDTSTVPMPLNITDPDRTIEFPPRAMRPAAVPHTRPPVSSAVDDAMAALDHLDSLELPSLPSPSPKSSGLQLAPLHLDTQPMPLAVDPGFPAPVTVEELIDLEQQVDFFMVLGQDDAAIELLSGRLGERAAASGLPYLKLMELYQRRGDRDAYDRIASRFAQHFQARPPSWSEDLNEGTGLEAHEELLQRLEAAWPDPAGSMSLLQDLLSRHQEYSGDLGLPAYRDLLMLYAVARDRAEHELRNGDVDVVLPLDATTNPDMMATMVFQAPTSPGKSPLRAAVVQSVDLDLSLVDDEPPEAPKPL
ncbi:hypothetical protein [Roseateles amylovorans]|uniref:Tfp pilus assembly protein FimV n=1 Tax=Roseateles amylovorans TaxID=2978473 RepID=A0ABY6AZA7_9BURK|nr:hypothetical protein [Roseateles amylovorans]UXH76415.1 hypothetical protein N4261_15255 [Roseateles amylovorans]